MVNASQFSNAYNAKPAWTSNQYFGGGGYRYADNSFPNAGATVMRAQQVTPGTTTINPDLNVAAVNAIPKAQGGAGSMPQGTAPISQAQGQGWASLISALGGAAQGFLTSKSQPQAQQQQSVGGYTPALANFQMVPLGQGQQQIYG